MNILHIMRVVLLGLVALFSVIILALAAHLTSITESFIDNYFTFAALAIAISVLTILTVTPLLVLDRYRPNSITPKIIIELPVLCVLAILWLATGADTATLGSLIINCRYSLCHEVQSIEAFSFLNWLILMGYSITLFVLSVIASSKGQAVWHSSVKETNFFADRPGVFVQTETHKTEHPSPVLPTQGYTTQGYMGGVSV